MSLVALFALLCVLVLTTSAFAAGPEGKGRSKGDGKALHSAANLDLLPPMKSDPSVATRPGRPAIKSPTALSTVGTSTQLVWNEVQGADSYHLQVATDPNFKWLKVNENFVKSSSFDLSGLDAGTQYFWRVAARAPLNEAEYTKGDFTASSFTVK